MSTFLILAVCVGDNGGPLMMFTPTRQWVLVGIIDTVYSCPSIYPSGYTRMTRFLDWIRSMNVTDAVAIDIVNTPPTMPPLTSVITNAATSMAPVNTSASATSTATSLGTTTSMITSTATTITEANSHSTARNKGDSLAQHIHVAASAMALLILIVMAPWALTNLSKYVFMRDKRTQ